MAAVRIEERWLLALADPRGPARPLPAEPLDLRALTSLCILADLHGVLPAVLGAVDAALASAPGTLLSDPAVAPSAVAAIEPARRRLAERCAMAMFLGGESRRVARTLAASGIDSIILKGADFAARLYANPSLRPYIDIDLLVREADWARIPEAMTALGYRPRADALKYAEGYGEASFEHPDMPGAVVEVHRNLVNSPTVRRGVSVRLDDVPLDRTGGILRATPAGLLLIASVHGAASHSFDKLQHLCDIAQAARGVAGPIDEAALRAAIDGTGAALSVASGLDLAARTFDAPECAGLLDRLSLRWRKRTVRFLLTPATVARSQGPRRGSASWRRQVMRHLLKRRP